jgi:DNA end-binding protein Ku
VSVPIELYAAQRKGGVSFRMLAPGGEPIQRQYVCPKDDEVLGAEDIERGYPVGKNRFVVVSDEELAALAPRRSRDIELSRFVPRDAIGPAYFERAYFVVPAGERSKAYQLLAEVMEKNGRAALGSFVMHDKAHAVAIFADGGVLRAATLRFGDELRSSEDVGLPKPKKPDARRVAKMRKAIEKLAKSGLDEKELVDPETERMLALARKKQKRGKDVIEAPEAEGEEEAERGEVIDLVAVLKERLASRARAPTPRRSSRRRR